MSQAYVHPFAPPLAGQGLETLSSLGVLAFGGIALAPVPLSLAAAAKPLFGRNTELLDEEEAASRLAQRIISISDGPRQQAEALAADLAAAGRLLDDAQKLAKRSGDDAVATIDAHLALLAEMHQRHARPLPTAVERVLRLAKLGRTTAPLVHHSRVRDARAELEGLLDRLDKGRSELDAIAVELADLREKAVMARAGSILDLEARRKLEAPIRQPGKAAGADSAARGQARILKALRHDQYQV